MVLRACPGLSAKVMNERWRKMIRFGIMRRTVFGSKPPVEVEYQLTPFGRRFIRILDEVRRLQEAVDDRTITETSQPRKKTPSSGRVTPSKNMKRPSAPGFPSKDY
jgi:DNA-binding HxlR family transcriptional regulator